MFAILRSLIQTALDNNKKFVDFIANNYFKKITMLKKMTNR
jgi:hypothetical protein